MVEILHPMQGGVGLILGQEAKIPQASWAKKPNKHKTEAILQQIE